MKYEKSQKFLASGDIPGRADLEHRGLSHVDCTAVCLTNPFISYSGLRDVGSR